MKTGLHSVMRKEFVGLWEYEFKSNGLSYRPHGEKGTFPMVAYYENEAAVIAALKRAKTPQEVIKTAQDLKQRMAPSHWIQRAVQVLYSMT